MLVHLDQLVPRPIATLIERNMSRFVLNTSTWPATLEVHRPRPANAMLAIAAEARAILSNRQPTLNQMRTEFEAIRQELADLETEIADHGADIDRAAEGLEVLSEQLRALRCRDYEAGLEMFTVLNLDKPRVVGSRYMLKPTDYNDRSPEICHVRDQDDIECPICYDEYTDGVAVTRLPCNHIFHTACARESFKRSDTCPMCRAPLPVTRPRRYGAGAWIERGE